jgi:subtilisin family serine protease
VKALVLLAVAAATAVVLWVSAAGAAQNSSGGPLAKGVAVTKGHIPLSKTSGTLPRSMKGVPSEGSYAFLLKLKTEPTGMAYNAFRYAGKAAASTAAKNQLATVHTAQRNVVAALPSGSHVLYETHAALAGVAVYTKVANLAALQRISQVEKIYPIAPKTPSNSYAVHLQKAPQVWQTYGDTGQNSTVAIIDTGIDYTHADFGGPGTAGDYNAVDPTIDPTPGSFDPAKFVGGNVGHDFAGDAYDANPQDPGFDPTPAPDSNPLDCNSHGTHVAGIIAGYGENTDGSTYTDGYNALGGLDSGTYQSLFKIGPGMAPDAKIISYKVFGCEGSTDLVGEALDAAADPNNDGSTADHVDVVNMSLGSDYGSPQDGDSVLSNADSALGISVVVAAGNGGDLYDVGGSPGDATRVIGVAASVDAYNQIDTLHATVNGTDHDYGAQRSVAYDWANQPAGDLSGNVVEIGDHSQPPSGTNNTDGCDAISQDLTGKVVFLTWTDDSTVRRCGSATRSGNAENAGAIGVILGEDQETFSAGITGSADIPVVQVVKSASDEIETALNASQPVSVSGTDANNFEQLVPGDDDKVASFSSRGIRNAGDVKPDVSAVGQSVFSAGMGTGDDGLSDSGTSMATPMVAGLSALVRSENSSWNPEQVKADIMNTADQDLFTGSNHTGDNYAPNRVGAGRIDAKAALDNQVLAYVTDDPGAVSASFGTIEATGPMTLHKTIKLDNQGGSDETYDTSYDALTSVPGADYSVSPSQVTVAAGQTATVTLTLTIDPTQLTKTADPTTDPFQDGLPREFVADASGRVLFTPEDSSPTLRVPVYSAPRPASVMTQPSSLDMPSGSIQSASLPLTGTGIDQGGGPENITSIVAGFELQAKSPALPDCSISLTSGCIHASDEKAADLKYVGTTSDAPELTQLGDDPADELASDGEEYFAITTQGPWHTAASQNEYDIYIDTNGDGSPDLVTFNTRIAGTDVLIDETIDLNTDQIVDEEPLNDRFANTDTALFDSDTLVMPVWLQPMADEGLSVGASRITYGIVTFGQFSSDPVDSVGFDHGGNLDGSLSTDVLNPGVAVFGDVNNAGGNGYILYQDQPNTSLTVQRDAASYAADHGMGAMIVHFHNTVGNKAQIVDLDHHSLTVQKSGAGTGTVTSSPSGINCGSTCTASFSSGAQVTLTATPSSDSTFSGWSGGGCSGTGTCQVTLNADATVTATFIPKVTLTVSTSGSGSGSVTSSPAGIDCGATCSAAFANGTSVTLTASADSGSKFSGWSGGGCSGTGTCQVTLTAATSVTASFAKNTKKKDTTKPKVTSVKVKVNHGAKSAKVTFHGTDPGNGSKGLHFKCKLDKGSFKSCRSPKTYKHLKRGKHTVQVKAIDKAGNVSKTVKKKFTV